MWKYNKISNTWSKNVQVGFFTIVYILQYDENLSSYYLKNSFSTTEISLLTKDIDNAKEMADELIRLSLNKMS